MTVILAAAAWGAAILVWVEWQRSDLRHRFARISASVLAVVALTLVGVYRSPLRSEPRTVNTAAALWMAGAVGNESAPAGVLRFSLPDATAKPPDAIVVPDAAFLRTHYPEINSLHVIGDGLEPHDLDALRDLQLLFQPSTLPPSRAAVIFLHAPRQIALGEQVKLHGRIGGLAPGENVRLVLESPGGAKTETVVAKDGEAGPSFEISAASPPAVGQFIWKLKLSATSAPDGIIAEGRIGVSVVAATLPRVLVLESSPRLDTAHLQRWFGENGGSFRSRTLVGEGRYRYASTEKTAAEFGGVDAELLEQMDVLIVDAGALAALLPTERAAIQLAVSSGGLGILTGASISASTSFEESEFFLPWKTSAREAASSPVENEILLARLQWEGIEAPLDHPVPIEPFAIEPANGQRVLITDSQGRAIVNTIRRGRGLVALSLVRDTWRWRLENHAANFAQYWSFLFSELSRPQSGAGQWAIGNAETERLSVNRPIDLLYSGSAEALPSEAIVADDKGQTARLPLAEDWAEPTKWRTTFWPRRSGWHRSSILPDGVPLNFFVYETEEWSSLAPERRRAATEQFVELARPRSIESRTVLPRSFFAPAGAALPALFFTLFVMSSSYLWLERRKGARSE